MQVDASFDARFNFLRNCLPFNIVLSACKITSLSQTKFVVVFQIKHQIFAIKTVFLKIFLSLFCFAFLI